MGGEVGIIRAARGQMERTDGSGVARLDLRADVCQFVQHGQAAVEERWVGVGGGQSAAQREEGLRECLG